MCEPSRNGPLISDGGIKMIFWIEYEFTLKILIYHLHYKLRCIFEDRKYGHDSQLCVSSLENIFTFHLLIFQGTLLPLKNIQPGDRGVYMCTALNTVGSFTNYINLNVRCEYSINVAIVNSDLSVYLVWMLQRAISADVPRHRSMRVQIRCENFGRRDWGHRVRPW